MPPADTLPGARLGIAVGSRATTISGWGGGPAVPVRLAAPGDPQAVQELIGSLRAGGGAGAPGGDGVLAGVGVGVGVGAIPRGRGRSYGDAAQLRNGVVVDITRLTATELDPATGVITAQAGVTIGELLAQVAPHGFVVPVVPGTQHVSLGGAIGSDIHGKNHGSAGTLGSHVQALGLVTSGGELLEVEPGHPAFEATLGGMGLTGVIVWARLVLRRVQSALLVVDTDRVGDIDSALAILASPGGPHRVAWLDLLGPRAGRGVVTRAEHAPAPEPGADPGRATVPARATVPTWFPSGLLRPRTVGAFNELRFRAGPRHERGRLEPFGPHMFPLDGLDAWPRLYGRAGFHQYQLVVPVERHDVLHAVVGCLAGARVPCYLAVLKDFGPANSAPLSFPIRGWTLALDLPSAAPGLEAALARCDELVAEAGGRVYLTKDARLSPEMVRAMYPRLEEWRAIRDGLDPDGLWRSDLAVRTGLIERAAS